MEWQFWLTIITVRQWFSNVVRSGRLREGVQGSTRMGLNFLFFFTKIHLFIAIAFACRVLLINS